MVNFDHFLLQMPVFTGLLLYIQYLAYASNLHRDVNVRKLLNILSKGTLSAKIELF